MGGVLSDMPGREERLGRLLDGVQLWCECKVVVDADNPPVKIYPDLKMNFPFSETDIGSNVVRVFPCQKFCSKHGNHYQDYQFIPRKELKERDIFVVEMKEEGLQLRNLDNTIFILGEQFKEWNDGGLGPFIGYYERHA